LFSCRIIRIGISTTRVLPSDITDGAERAKILATARAVYSLIPNLRQNDPSHCRSHHGDPARRQQGGRREGRDIVVFQRQRRILRCSTAAYTPAHRSTRRACVARLTPEPGAISARGSASCCAAPGHGWNRHPQRAIIFRSGPRQGPTYPVVIEDGETWRRPQCRDLPVHVEDSYTLSSRRK
jgi:hypothetical protein